MVALRYIAGFFLQIAPCAFFCLYPFWNRFCVNRKNAMVAALCVLGALAVPFSLIGQFNVGGDYEELFCNILFYAAVLFFLCLYLKAICGSISEKLFVFFVVMSYGFLVSRVVSFLAWRLVWQADKFMYPPMALLVTLGINLLAAKPIMLLMDRIRSMADAQMGAHFWRVLCIVPVLFMSLASAVIFRSMEDFRRQQEEYRNAERMLEGYRAQAENNERNHEIHHEIKHHLNALSLYLEQQDYGGAQKYLQKFAEETEKIARPTYTAHPLVNSILAELAARAKQKGIVTTMVENGVFTVTANLCLAEETAGE